MASSDVTADTVYELRVYHLNEGKLPLLLDRFRNHTEGLFKRYGIESVAYWTPDDEPLTGRTLFYMIRHKSRTAAKENWDKFKVDPEWVALKLETEKDGPFITKMDTTYMTLTNFSLPV